MELRVEGCCRDDYSMAVVVVAAVVAAVAAVVVVVAVVAVAVVVVAVAAADLGMTTTVDEMSAVDLGVVGVVVVEEYRGYLCRFLSKKAVTVVAD